MIPIITGFLAKINKKIIIAVIMVLIVSIFIVLIAAKDSEIHQKEKEIAQYQENIKGLELQAETLQNEILFIKENEKFQNSFSNSDAMIKSIDKEKLTRTEYETFNSISNNFYKYFNSINIMSGTNKICQNTAFYASRNLYYKVRNKSAGFNEEVSGKYYKNRRMADLVQHTSRNKLLLI